MVLRFVYFILAFVLFTSCGKQKQEVTINKTENSESENSALENRKEKTENSESENSALEDRKEKTENSVIIFISTLEVNEHVGKNAEVKGYVADVVVRPKVIYLNFDRKYPKNTFTAVIFPGNADKFGNVEQYRNKNVTVSGKIETFNGKPQIILNRKEQLTINN
ncbi:MAG: hypothetical protein MUE56_05525 [Ignavibacteria bacterium]|jgi:hypothetical protein|nr:hypothetical protein [Ignavibacteria bacterium]